MNRADIQSAPLYEMLMKHASKESVSFHVPGHKQRTMYMGNEESSLGAGCWLNIDVTELSDTDDLHDPTGAIAEAQELAAQCFGAEETRFLVGGSTAGNLAMILGICEPGEILLVQRNVHKSIIHGLALAGARCVFLAPEADERSGIPVAPSVETVTHALERYPTARALILCSPNYYGMTADLPRLVDAAHARKVPVLVDEAHGAHFGLHPDIPGSALQAGADVVVQSTHKMLASLTMSAMLHIQGELAPRPEIRQALRMVQSSSPSYPLLASLDLARREVQTQGPALFEQALSAAHLIREALTDLPLAALNVQDPLKLSIREATGRMTGFELQAKLEERGCLAEMADINYTVLALGSGTRIADAAVCIDALSDIARELKEAIDIKAADASSPNRDQTNATLREPSAKRSPVGSTRLSDPVVIRRRTSSTTAIPLREAAGHICGEWIIPYPPGIPLLYPGEPVSAVVVEELRRLAAAGARFQGATDETLSTIQVLTRGDD
ncbi:aminotransferase class I/II-fold pyridoxal phosphate-dependent enzyme [Cohnella sp. JJ-181]|uniref:aminotransferase class I/II-fold pyridoxal phosphate-dependent enzyme n=1 Tax=Cohnella rhizoplanae TaxID=2974897 RepID=UPI0022FFC274|nr:aminotransferase class I/II-fold pyridoxal phosphate-dependent enzyme [Cohnella sp. JJ-181]CAI6084853.1 Arginine decarboxylase [Cohnella sp. JJ-181]